MQVEVSNGELVDKITILSIKLKMIKDPKKLRNVKSEYEVLVPKMLDLGIDENAKEYEDLLEINQILWNVEDSIREKESLKEFDEEFIKLARSVYISNDKRAAIKRKINMITNSALIEKKDYSEYESV